MMPDETIDLSPNITLEWYAGHRILVYTLRSSDRKTVDIWADKAIEIIYSLPDGKPYLAMYDVTQILTLTPYARKRSEDIGNAVNDRQQPGATAIVLGKSVVSNVFRLFVQRDLRNTNPFINRLVTQDWDEAFEWLQDQSEQYEDRSS